LVIRFHGGDAHAHHITSQWVGGDVVWRGTIDGDDVVAQVRPLLNGVQIAHAGYSAQARCFTRREADLFALMPATKSADTSKTLLCPMPGLVKAVMVSAGQEVKAGEALCMVEAMKMENVLRAERDVTISKINAREGDSLAVDVVIMEFA
jgi:propionyl-CoA carboxylase alpha chain